MNKCCDLPSCMETNRGNKLYFVILRTVVSFLFIPQLHFYMSTAEELTIPTPWGHISAKYWRSSKKQRVLAIHGLNDNAASFDQLVPLLLDQLCVVCVDLPGHGLSSPFPSGLSLSILDYATTLRLVVDHLQWQDFGILAHSFGSHIAVYFTALFRPLVIRFLLIDPFFAHVIPESKFVIERCLVAVDEILKTGTRNRRTYKYEESIKKLCEGRQTMIGTQNAEALQKRAFRKTPNGYVHNNDERLKLLTYPLISFDFHFGIINGIKCPGLIISTSEFEPFLSTPATEKTISKLSQILGSSLKVIKTKGTHDIHMDQPQKIASFVKKFLAQINSHL